MCVGLPEAPPQPEHSLTTHTHTHITNSTTSASEPRLTHPHAYIQHTT